MSTAFPYDVLMLEEDCRKCPICNGPPKPRDFCFCVHFETESKCWNGHMWHWHKDQDQFIRVAGPSSMAHQEEREVYGNQACHLCPRGVYRSKTSGQRYQSYAEMKEAEP